MFYGTQTWNPVLIVAQICTIQALFYITFGLCLWLLVGPYVSGHLALAHFFGSNWIGFHSFVGWMAILATTCNAIPLSVAILLVVERAKKCLDFAATAYLLHLGMACILIGFPKSAAWWAANGVAFVITAVLSEWLCLRRELQDIPIGGFAKKRSGALQGTELLPLHSLPTAPASNPRPSQSERTLFGRLKASFSKTNNARETIRLADEV